MKRTLRIICLLIVLALFALMALGSGSSSSSSSSSDASDSKEPEDNDSSVLSDILNDDEAESDEAAENDSSDDEPAYEVGEGKVVLSNSYDTIWAQISVPVTNTGKTDLYLGSGTMDLEDADGHLVDSISMVSVYPPVLQPGETAWYYEETILDQAPESDLTVVPHVDVSKAKVACIRYEVSDVSLVDEEFGGIKITGRVKNTTEEDGSGVYVAVNMYNADNEFIGQAFTILDNDLKSGDQMGFSASTFGSFDIFETANVDHYDVYAFPLQFQF